MVLCWSNPRSWDRQNHVAPQSKPNPASQKSNLTKTLLSACKLFMKSDIFFADFRGSVCQNFEYQSGKKTFKIQPSTYRSYPKEPVYAVSTTNMPFEAAQAQKETFLFFQALDHDRLLFWRKLQWKKLWMEGNCHQQSEPAGHRHGSKERHRLHEDAKKHVYAWQGLSLKISKNRRAGCLQERK